METRPQAETAEGLEKFMVVGLLVVSTLVAAFGSGLSLYLGIGWLNAMLVYMATGAATTFLLVLKLIIVEMRRPDHEETRPSYSTRGDRARTGYEEAA